jgi:hypothetical protein
MKTETFQVDSLTELRVLQRVFREAKFCKEADDEEVSASPLVSELFERLMTVLIEAQVRSDGEIAREKWKKWLTMTDSSRDEWLAVRDRARRHPHWLNWTKSERRDYASLLFRPFVLDEKTLEIFVSEVTSTLDR